jgi:hypothetical protein
MTASPNNDVYPEDDVWVTHRLNCGCERCVPTDTLLRWELRVWNRMHNCPRAERPEVKDEWRRLIREIRHRDLFGRVIWR